MLQIRIVAVAMLIGAAISSSACASPLASGPRARCAFGAETAALAAWCAEVNFGGDGDAVAASARPGAGR